MLRGGAGYTCRNLLVICLLFFGSCAVYQSHLYAVKYPAPESSEYLYFRDYQAHTWGNKLTGLRMNRHFCSLKIGCGSMAQRLACRYTPRLFMRLRAFRMISALKTTLKTEGTIEAYQNILNGNADLIFVAQPSTAQKQLAEASGVKLVYTPLHVKRLCLSSTKTIPCHR